VPNSVENGGEIKEIRSLKNKIKKYLRPKTS
jgi:hypothetical protein